MAKSSEAVMRPRRGPLRVGGRVTARVAACAGARHGVRASAAAPEATSAERELPERMRDFPQLRFMGSKVRLLPWLGAIFRELEFDTALDAFSGSGAVAYLLKAMGKEVTANDFLTFGATVGRALIENSTETLDEACVARLRRPAPRAERLIATTFRDVFYTRGDLAFLDRLSANVARIRSPGRRALALSAAIRGCLKRQPRGVFTVAGDPARYKDGRRDLRLSLEEHFVEQVDAYNRAVFSNGRANRALHGDVFAVEPRGFDLVYLDPPYVPRADDNCYVKRYHFVEGLACYWRGMPPREDSKVKKIAKRYTPFSYRKDALSAFERLFAQFAASTIVLSYSSNGYPDLDVLVALLRRHKRSVVVHERPHRYHFGTHRRVAPERAAVTEYAIVGT